MKHFDIDWIEFLRQIPLWNQLPPQIRERLANLGGNQGVKTSAFGGHDRLLAEHDLVEYFAGGERVRLTRPGEAFATTVRAMIRHDILAQPDENTLVLYLEDHFTREELYTAYAESCRRYSYYAYMSRGFLSQLARHVASVSWPQRFLARTAKKSSFKSLPRGVPSWLRIRGQPAETAVDLDLAKRLVRHLMELSEPIPLAEVPTRWNDLPLDSLGPAIREGIERMVLFPAMRRPEMTPMLGLWPAVHRRLHRPKAVAPAAVKPREVVHSAWIVEDMTTVLVAASGRPLRLRGNDFSLFAKVQNELRESLLPMPDWFAETLKFSPDSRIPLATDWLQRLKLARRAGLQGMDLRLEMTDEGERWLGETAKRRLQIVLDAIRAGTIARPSLASLDAREDYDDAEADDALDDYYGPSPISFLPFFFEIDSRQPAAVEEELRREVAAAFGSLTPDCFVPLDEFLAWRAQEANPLPRILQASKSHRNANEFLDQPPIETLEDSWTRFLKEMLRRRLVVLGGVRWGVDEKTGKACFAMTEAGRYLLGLADDFEYRPVVEAAAQLVVQPNFDVVFLAASPLAEASVARFAERKGRGVGTLFSITKKSIIAAAATGMTATQVLDTLQSLSAKPVPANVAHEISGWFDQCRRVRIRSTILIHCPDADTALRVVAAGRKHAKALTDTVVELTEPQSKSEFLRKLQAAGIFIDRKTSNV